MSGRLAGRERVLAAIRRHHLRKAEESMRRLVEGAREDLWFCTGQTEAERTG